jgi:6-hydroxy-3-succinoylpyridine 3-monooxygenase
MPQPHSRRTTVYIDGFNLYYGAIRDTPDLKWLDIARFCKLLRPHDDLRLIRYFTALIEGPTKSNQETYLRALATTPLVEVILGKFKRKTLKCRVPACSFAGARHYDTQEEKRTDVNIAVFMLDDAYRDQCDQLILFSGDSDLVPAVNMVRLTFPEKQIIVYVPSRNPTRGAAVELRTAAHAHRSLPLQLLAKAQFANQIPDGYGGQLRRPPDWA